MAQPGFIRNFSAEDIIPPNRLVAVSAAADFHVGLAIDASAIYAGVTEQGTDDHLRVDVVMTQSAPIEFGGDIAAGDLIVADADGKAIGLDLASYVGETKIHVAGWAMEEGDAGTIGDIFLAPQLIATIPSA
ncbi:hypothetical protein [Pseudoalteromonas sp. 1_2015MBL_MicDiv]|uniref:hypothetical protein n=1 Tax=Pseudoalteromonas sp. 1_2015MBL_MicDiv TaxID=1720343 RepID=UPI000BBE1938|nr:hypothetical protein [Pseudoalteromonas sp. 1_2015MBL_MicDiv]ATG77646.1 hypothetical protein AOR04_08915 [Pseudoalteromonas sp. 1_2015MBL_MicDiv]